MKTVTVHFENGDTITTRINGTDEEIKAYYLGRYFNLGTVGDNMQKAVAVEFAPRGLRCSIYESKDIGNCSNDGISARCKTVTLMGIPGAEIFEADEEAPAVVIVKREVMGREYTHIEPLKEHEQRRWLMFGGAFIWTSDARFPSKAPIKLHDRIE